MKIQEFVDISVSSLDENWFKKLKKNLINDRYIPVAFINNDNINRAILKEKISDYFEKIELNFRNSFSETVDNYAVTLDSVVLDHIDKYSPLSRNSISRSKRYYDEARKMKKEGLNTFGRILDYTRIMLCLYMAIINNNHNSISDFDLSSECLEGKRIMESLRKEEIVNIVGRKKRFDTKGAYSSDRSAFIILIIMYHYIKSMEVEV